MNWIFDTYSNVYSTAMMQNTKISHHPAQKREIKILSPLAKLFDRG
jgi:hypothetical protein